MRIRWGKSAVAVRFAAVLAAAGAAAPAHAASRAQREVEAYQACSAGRVEQGIEILASLLVDYGHPNYIYNQARCYQQNGRAEAAMGRFREYQRAVPNGSTEERARIDRFVRELQVELRRAPEPPPRLPSDNPPADLRVPHAAPEEAPAAHRLRTLGLVLGGVAIAGTATGIASGLHLRSLAREVENAPAGRFSVDDLAARQSRAHRFEVIEWIGYGLGGAAALGAAVAFVLDARAGEPSQSARLHASLHPAGGAALSLAGRF